MRPVTKTVSAVGSSDPIIMDIYQAPFAVGLGVKISGTPTYTVEHTFDDPFSSTFATDAVWYDHPTLAAETANADGNYAFPVRAIRITMDAGVGSATLTVIQATGSNGGVC